jgi:uncharacterized membrane protein
MILRVHRRIIFLLLTVVSLLSAAFYTILPARVPIHWNMEGQPDGFGAAWIDAFVLPACGWVLMTLAVFGPFVKPFRPSMVRFARVYGRICVTLTSLLVAIQVIVLFSAAGKPVSTERALFVVAGLAIAIIGNWLGKIRRNTFVGIRTPWTLANDEVWEQTNRMGGRIAVVFGLVESVVSVIALPSISIAFLLVGLITIGVWAMVYSYRLHRAHLPDRRR